jgi:membrane protein DedA with SNARE-associated domain
MGHYNLDALQLALVHHGYWFLRAVLLLENVGVPLPGETILLLASYLAASHRGLYLPYVIGAGTVAAVLGDNVGFLIGARGGRPLLDRYGKLLHITDETIYAAERRMERHGAAVVFGARFVAGIRVIAGPIAGALHMDWRRFALWGERSGLPASPQRAICLRADCT